MPRRSTLPEPVKLTVMLQPSHIMYLEQLATQNYTSLSATVRRIIDEHRNTATRQQPPKEHPDIRQ